jgi:hypothetical protein
MASSDGINLLADWERWEHRNQVVTLKTRLLLKHLKRVERVDKETGRTIRSPRLPGLPGLPFGSFVIRSV